MKDTDLRNWQASLVAGVAVLGVVAALLQLLLECTRRICEGSSAIWQTGKLIAGNTVHIPILARVNQNIGNISQAANGIAEATGRIRSATAGSSKKEG